MFGLLIVGALLIVLNYLRAAARSGVATSVPARRPGGLILGGIIVATQYR